MKLATLKDGSRDGQLIVVSRDLKTAVIADAVASHLQRVLDDWPFYAPQLDELYEALNHGRARRAFAFAPEDCMAPLPRAYQWIDVAPVADADDHENSKAHQVDGAALHWRDGASPRASAQASGLEHAVPTCYAPGLAAVVGEIAPAQAVPQILPQVRLAMLALTIRGECGARAPAQDRVTIFSPVAITPDEFGAGWHEGRIELPFAVRHNARRVDAWDRAAPIDLGACLALATRAQTLSDGALVSTSLRIAPPAQEPMQGETLAPMRELDDGGQASAAPGGMLRADWLAAGDRLRLDMFDAKGHSLCGVIEASLRDSNTGVREAAEADERARQDEAVRQQDD